MMTTSNEHNNAPAVPQGVPEINYPALIEAAFAKNRKWTQGTTGCIAFARGAEWFRELMLGATPAPAPAPAVPQGWKLVPEEPTPEMVRCAEMWDDGFEGAYARALASAPSPTPAQEVATLSLAAEDVHAAFAKNFPKSRISQAWINFAADIAQAIAARAAKPAQEAGLTDEERQQVFRAAENRMVREINLSWRTAVVDEVIAALHIKGGK